MRTRDEILYQVVSARAAAGELTSLDLAVGPETILRRRRRADQAIALLGIAVLRRDIPLARALLALGVRPDQSTSVDASPLKLAVTRQYVDETELLLTFLPSARPNAGLDEALCEASFYANLDLVRMLLARGARAQAVVECGEGPLLRLKSDVLRALAEAGARLPPDIASLAMEGSGAAPE